MKKQIINQVINFFWTILCFVPVFIFWMDTGTRILLYVFIAIGVGCGLMPSAIFRRLQLSGNKMFYERLGVRIIQRFVQDGTLVNKARQKHPGRRNVIRNRTEAQKYISTANGYERFHLMCFVFFTISMVYAIADHLFGMAGLILAANIIYNVLPIMLQQYNRLRIMRILKSS